MASNNIVWGEDSSGQKFCVQLQPMSIGTGVSRVAYKGKILHPEDKKGMEIVVKRFKSDVNRASSQSRSQPDIAASKKARELAVKFNQQPTVAVKLSFLLPLTIRVTSITETLEQKFFAGVVPLRVGESVFLEPYLPGRYQKWISNTGKFSYPQEALLAFCHWTCVETGGQLLVCDLQGVKDDEGNYRLTDPAINSISRQYGSTDLGKYGIHMFFQQHTCTRLCRELGLRERVPGIASSIKALVTQSSSSTTYATQLPLDKINPVLPNPVIPKAAVARPFNAGPSTTPQPYVGGPIRRPQGSQNRMTPYQTRSPAQQAIGRDLLIQLGAAQPTVPRPQPLTQQEKNWRALSRAAQPTVPRPQPLTQQEKNWRALSRAAQLIRSQPHQVNLRRFN